MWLVTSDGRLYDGPEGEDDERVPFRLRETGVGRLCEIEGLVFHPGEQTLWLACKTPRTPELRGSVAVFRWSPGEERLLFPPLRVPLRDVLARTGGSSFRPSGIELDPATGHALLVSAVDGAVIEIDAIGRVLASRAIDPRFHRQAEGIALSAEGDLLVADEGRGSVPRLTRYRATGSGGPVRSGGPR